MRGKIDCKAQGLHLPRQKALDRLRSWPKHDFPDLVGPIHLCPTCFVRMYPFCGTPAGTDSFGQYILCPGYNSGAGDEAVITSGTNHVEVTDRPPRARSSQHVSTIHRRRVLVWMVEHEKANRKKLMFARAVDEFPAIFNSATRNANLSKALSWWNKREKLLNPPRGAVELPSLRSNGRSRVNIKELAGRGHPRSKWVNWLYPRLVSEFDRPSKLGLKFDSPLP
ncbi:Hypothetical protein PHPALM_14030 [Phytophthora palmivora]|uniref:Uncharacterized protein n=1 Tax=Phytophthora palmivora TaxID=4796 RepID=A0A2P4XVS9_9STRA|nr:Hypothetical protein PHPALM_14030 [Phytophthora palmivora]